MTKWKKIALGSVVVIILVLIGYKTWQKSHSAGADEKIAQDDSNVILFYGRECPHCQAVEEYISNHQIDQKVAFSKREVYHNSANANLLKQKAQGCDNVDIDKLGVPFLWSEGKCYVGDNEVENFLDAAAAKSIQPETSDN